MNEKVVRRDVFRTWHDLPIQQIYGPDHFFLMAIYAKYLGLGSVLSLIIK